jgi:hypothetical protein
LALIPLKEGAAFGRITLEHPRHGEYRRHLEKVTQSGFARFAG